MDSFYIKITNSIKQHLKEKNHSKKLEINTMYNLIDRLNNEKDELTRILNQYGKFK